MTDEQVKHMLDRFLGWGLPRDFNPDAGISYIPPKHPPHVGWMPTGTNLFDAQQAEAMIRYMVEGLPMSDNITQFPKPVDQPPLLIGPFEEWRVQVEGRIIPRLTGFRDGDKITLVVDRRFSATFAKEDAHQAAWLIAQALAIGEGYPSLGATDKRQPFAPIGMSMEAPEVTRE